ncbi:DUF4118 domain-containing protein [Novosphingobium sp. KCTC 2891]|uniref:sensor histidine kinase n=1 Tax=Novosphingobium sp. KCTC 2891 TaxID=2989730 RepID=UPI0022234489|nr:ATP-binding protein [Novosphingobium sp. KCTC 2891]MCW1384400.1 DUF4118 domain-containing protein [Novosphingobium sp. KCTC 2891]
MPSLPRSLSQPIRGLVPRYATGVALFFASFGIRVAADHLFPPGFPFLTFFPAVILATFLAGRGPGFLCGALSGFAALYFFVPPFHSLQLDAGRFTALVFFGLVVVVDVMLIDGLVRRHRQLVENEARLTRMADMQTLLFKELQHRVANNLASVASMLRLQRRRIVADPASALDVIDRADERIELMGRVHRQLYDPQALGLSVAEQIRRAAEQAQDVSAAGHVRVEVHADDVVLEINRLMTLVLLITELLGNSFKHAFDPHAEAPTVRVSLERGQPGQLRLTVADNGRGLPSQDPASHDRAAAAPRGLGTTIIKGFVAQLGGSIKVCGAPGVTTMVEFAEG